MKDYRSRELYNNRIIDRHWNAIFDEYQILDAIEDKGKFYITSKDINKFKEARLMTKFDFEVSLPDIFYNNYLSILPTRRGEYVIGQFKTYTQISNKVTDFRLNRKEVKFPDWVETLDYKSISSESTMLNAAVISGMFNNMFNIGKLYQTVSGRMGSEKFGFNIADSLNPQYSHKINVSNSQIEIDGGYETEKYLIIVEAKNDITSTFLTRQLYYPYRLWENKVNKKIIPVFLQYYNGTYNFSVYDFRDRNMYSSIQLLNRFNFIISDEELKLADIEHLLNSTNIGPEPEIPFPQANDLAKVISTLESIYNSEEGSVHSDELSLMHEFVGRQSDYYANAGRYLGLLERSDSGTFALTNLGIEIMDMNLRGQRLGIIKQVLKHEIFSKSLKLYLNTGGRLTTNDVFEIIKNNNLEMYNVKSEVTILRRASTVVKWVKDIMSMCERT